MNGFQLPGLLLGVVGSGVQPSTWIALATPTNYLAPQFTATPPGALATDTLLFELSPDADMSGAGTPAEGGVVFGSGTYTVTFGVVSAVTHYARATLKDALGNVKAQSAILTVPLIPFVPTLRWDSSTIRLDSHVRMDS